MRIWTVNPDKRQTKVQLFHQGPIYCYSSMAEQHLVRVKVVGSVPTNSANIDLWGISSVGRASHLQCEGHRFDSYIFHQCMISSVGQNICFVIKRSPVRIWHHAPYLNNSMVEYHSYKVKVVSSNLTSSTKHINIKDIIMKYRKMIDVVQRMIVLWFCIFK